MSAIKNKVIIFSDDGDIESLAHEEIPPQERSFDLYELRVKMTDAMGDLRHREKTALKLRFGLDGNPPLTLKEIGQRIGGVCPERARFIVEQALRKLRRPHRARHVKMFADPIILMRRYPYLADDKHYEPKEDLPFWEKGKAVKKHD